MTNTQKTCNHIIGYNRNKNIPLFLRISFNEHNKIYLVDGISIASQCIAGKIVFFAFCPICGIFLEKAIRETVLMFTDEIKMLTKKKPKTCNHLLAFHKNKEHSKCISLENLQQTPYRTVDIADRLLGYKRASFIYCPICGIRLNWNLLERKKCNGHYAKQKRKNLQNSTW